MLRNIRTKINMEGANGVSSIFQELALETYFFLLQTHLSFKKKSHNFAWFPAKGHFFR